MNRVLKPNVAITLQSLDMGGFRLSLRRWISVTARDKAKVQSLIGNHNLSICAKVDDLNDLERLNAHTITDN